MCVCVVAEGLSRPHSSADGWSNPDLSASPAGCEHTIPGHSTEGAGQGGGERETQPHTGTYHSYYLTNHMYVMSS